MAQQEAAKTQKATAATQQTPEPVANQLSSNLLAPASRPSHTAIQRSFANPRALAPTDILQLQRTIGNQAVQRILNGEGVQTKLQVGAANDRYEQEADRIATQVTQPGHAPALQPQRLKAAAQTGVHPVIQRKMKLDRDQLNVLGPGGEAKTSDFVGRSRLMGRRFKETRVGKIVQAVKEYWATREASRELYLLEIIAGLSAQWISRGENRHSKKLTAMNNLHAAANSELPKARKQALYMTDLEKGKAAFDYISDSVKEAQVLSTTKKTLKGDKDAFVFRTEQENLLAAELVRKYELTDAELAAIKIYTVDDYKYINPAMVGNDAWLKSQIPEISSYDDKDSSPEGIAKAKAEGLRHGKMAKKGLKKLPDFTGHVFRGKTVVRDEVEDYHVGQILESSTFQSSSRDESISQAFIERELRASARKNDGKVGVLFDMEIKEKAKAKDVSMFSHAPDKESEVLMLPGTSFRITKIEKIDDMNWRITAEQVLYGTKSNVKSPPRTPRIKMMPGPIDPAMMALSQGNLSPLRPKNDAPPKPDPSKGIHALAKKDWSAF